MLAIRPALPDELRLELGADTEAIGGARQQTAFVARAPEGTWIWTAGRARLIQPAAERRRASGGVGDGVGRSVTPPMPAVVTKVLVEVGQEVEEGQALVVVSAMKMEMTLTAPHGGTVKAIHTEEGAKANPGDELVEVEQAS
ncbi:MAG: acetyl-CoA carboxylase biotin carboxyl carrier protein subunit [Deltaproteobacteria bacterium]|nr:acetyl-CoA carboxylase biotin carboxyl carrier protein subunit [Deltaproteobacteria bacterium]MBW2535492.1 acetyl-CoA carboxylase biotin carboxyl carrier protein subunit [Deltaproteobacteria bacterium]